MNELYQDSDLKRYAPENGGGEAWRHAFRTDYARVIHCPSFRRQQGKTQIFPGHESDFFRNRLTHSLEVAQIAESIALRLNAIDPFLTKNPIDPRLCITASYLHDIGHPPFGHNGEEALDECMRAHGGFEGNAQTLRIVSQLEKKRRREDIKNLIERRAGLNLTYRTLASILKYDAEIQKERPANSKVQKGYYYCDEPIVRDIKTNVCKDISLNDIEFKTVECHIMDIADDISYSTYDIEDTFKAGFLSPSKILTFDSDIMELVAAKVGKQIKNPEFSSQDVVKVFVNLFDEFTIQIEDMSPGQDDSNIEKLLSSLVCQQDFDAIAEDGYLRTSFTSYLVGRFINGTKIEINEKIPQLSRAYIDKSTLIEVEVLKNFTYEATIRSNRVALSEFRGKKIVKDIFEALDGSKGILLLPADFQNLYKSTDELSEKKRVICDFIAGMTDRYAMEFWSRLYSDNGTTIFKPL